MGPLLFLLVRVAVVDLRHLPQRSRIGLRTAHLNRELGFRLIDRRRDSIDGERRDTPIQNKQLKKK